jgi:hypothetical protein
MQFQDFNAAWAKYLEEYDRMAQMYIQQVRCYYHTMNYKDYTMFSAAAAAAAHTCHCTAVL